MLAFVVRRALGLIPTLLVIVVLSFLVIRLAPGSPFTSERGIPPEVMVDLQAKYGFDRPLPEQLGRYLSGLLHGDLGPVDQVPAAHGQRDHRRWFPVHAAARLRSR